MKQPVLVFTKAPIAGQVKTRLSPQFNAEQAAQIHTELVTLTLDKLNDFSVQLWCAPDTQHPFFQQCQRNHSLTLHQQRAGNLGDKMGHALQQTLLKHQYAVLIGTDIPALHSTHILQAINQLQQGKDAVITPTEDGGFCLIGLSKYHPNLFAKIEWGSNKVFSQLTDNLTQLKWRYHKQETLWDIDCPEDYLRYKAKP